MSNSELPHLEYLEYVARFFCVTLEVSLAIVNLFVTHYTILYSIEKGPVEEDCPFWKSRFSGSAAKSLILCYQTSIAEKACNPPTFNEISPATVAMFSSQSGLQIMQNAQA